MNHFVDNSSLPGTIPEALSFFERSEETALICGRERLSYRELLADAYHVAGALYSRGVRKGDRVVLDMSRSADYMRIYIGIIVSGAVSVTLHSGWPDGQREHVLEDCRPKMIIDDDTAKELMSCGVNEEDIDPVHTDIEPGDPFQIVYTSGSTGKPKGVVNCHELVISSLFNREGELQDNSLSCMFADHCRTLLSDTNTAYAASTIQFFMALLGGRTLVLATEEELMTPSALADCIRRNAVDGILGIPSRYYQYMEDRDFAAVLRECRLIMLAGEAVDRKILDEITDASGGMVLLNYGSTEAFHICDVLYHKGESILYESHPARTPLYVLEAGGFKQVPPGISGEICLGGTAGQYGCYWNDPCLTEEKYFHHPAYGRLFRTGDFATRKPDGRLRILGRMDNMAKIHGQRIEIDAIESAIESYQGIKRAAVKIQGEGAGAMLVAYYCGAADESELRRKLADSLPYYMVPARLVQLETMPLNINGKLDRRSLPPLRESCEEYLAPKTDTEKILCRVFETVLKTGEKVGVGDSFFALGGDSVRGLGCIALLRSMGYEMKIEWLFAAPEIRQLAPMLKKTQPGHDREVFESEELPEISRREFESIHKYVNSEDIEAVYPILPGMRYYFHTNTPLWICKACLIDAGISRDDLQRRLDESVRCHPALRTFFVHTDTDRPLQVILKERQLPVFSVDLRGLAPEGEDENELSDAQIKYLWRLNRLYLSKPFSDSLTDTLCEAGIIRISEKRSVMVLAGSHLILDGTGYVQLMKELAADARTVPDADQYYSYMRHILKPSYQRESLRIWQDVLSKKMRLTPLPPSSAAGVGQRIRVISCGNTFTEKALRFCAGANVSITALVCLSIGRALGELCNAGETGFLAVTSGRNNESIHLTGMFTNAFPIYTVGEDSLISVQEQILRGVRFPAASISDLCPDFGDPASGYHVSMSMQNYMEGEEIEDLFESPAFIKKVHGQFSEHTDVPFAKNNMVVLVYPYGSFNINLLYDEAGCSTETAGRFGALLLANLQRIVEDKL